MENTFLIAQIIGFFAMCFSISAWQIKKPKFIILCYVPSSLLWACQYLLLGANLAAYTNIANAVKDCFLAFLPQNYVRVLLGVFMMMVWGIGIVNYAQWHDALPMIGITMISLSYFVDRDHRSLICRAAIASQVCWVTYNMIVGAYMGVVCSSLVMVSSIIGMMRYESWALTGGFRNYSLVIVKEVFSIARLRAYP